MLAVSTWENKNKWCVGVLLS